MDTQLAGSHDRAAPSGSTQPAYHLRHLPARASAACMAVRTGLLCYVDTRGWVPAPHRPPRYEPA